MLFDWFKKQNPIKDFLGFGGGIGSALNIGVGVEAGVATGGTKTGPIGGYFFHHFTTVGTSPFKVNTAIPGARLILVAGGGSGCGGYGGGGGGGGIVYSNGTFPISTGEWTVEIGAGGAAPPSTYNDGNNGDNSNFYKSGASYPSPTYLRALGGGAGRTALAAGNSGGSGGGGGGPSVGPGTQPTANPGVSGITNAGNAGGRGPAGAPGYSHGGGGGAGGSGGSSNDALVSGPGGVGLGPPTWPWLPTSFGYNGYFGGGGGGSGYSSSATPNNGLGSPDGTGGQAYRIASQNGEPGRTNTGGGGGGASTPGPGAPYITGGGAGGPGAMVIAYPDTL
jgi:hypothetical protein